MICGGNVYAESKKVKAFIESLSLNRNDTDTPPMFLSDGCKQPNAGLFSDLFHTC